MNAPAHHLLTRRRISSPARAKSPDIVQDTIDALVAVLKQDGLRVTDEQRRLVESRIRDLWGGNRVYVGKQPTQQATDRALRDRTILDAWRSGTSAEELALRHGLTIRRIRQILNSTFAWKSNCLTHFHGQS